MYYKLLNHEFLHSVDDSMNNFDGNDSKINERPSMKELRKDLKSLSELINSAPAKIKDSDK